MQVITDVKREKVFMIMSNKNIYILFLFFAFALASCKDDSDGNNTAFFPEVQVNTSVNLLFPQFSALSLIQGYVYLPDGYRGIVLYRTVTDEFVAFDRTCPYNTNNTCAYITVDSTGFYYRCGQYNPNWTPCCDSKFDANTGMVSVGPARRGLKQYFTRRDGNVIYISNTPF